MKTGIFNTLGIALLFGFTFLLSFVAITEPDTFMYLAISENASCSGQWPITDPFLHSITDYTWETRHHWPGILFYYFLFKASGLWLLSFLVSGMALALLVLALGKRFFQNPPSPWLLTTAFLAIYAASLRFQPRTSFLGDAMTVTVFSIRRRKLDFFI